MPSTSTGRTLLFLPEIFRLADHWSTNLLMFCRCRMSGGFPGNHDTDIDADYDNLYDSRLAERNLHGRVVTTAGVRVAGLGGIFRGQVWMPPDTLATTAEQAVLRFNAGKGTTRAVGFHGVFFFFLSLFLFFFFPSQQHLLECLSRPTWTKSRCAGVP